jgi:hypothetical protein
MILTIRLFSAGINRDFNNLDSVNATRTAPVWQNFRVRFVQMTVKMEAHIVPVDCVRNPRKAVVRGIGGGG